MKKLLTLVLVLSMASLASATGIYLVGPEAGAPGSAGDPLESSETVRIYVTATGNLQKMIANVSLSGTATITNASALNGVNSGDLQTGPTDFTAKPGGRLEVMAPGSGFYSDGFADSLSDADIAAGGAAAAFGYGTPSGGLGHAPMGVDGSGYAITELAWIDVHCGGAGNVTLTISDGDADIPAVSYGTGSLDEAGDACTYGDALTIYQVPEPMTMVLLGLGGLGVLRRRRA